MIHLQNNDEVEQIEPPQQWNVSINQMSQQPTFQNINHLAHVDQEKVDAHVCSDEGSRSKILSPLLSENMSFDQGLEQSLEQYMQIHNEDPKDPKQNITKSINNPSHGSAPKMSQQNSEPKLRHCNSDQKFVKKKYSLEETIRPAQEQEQTANVLPPQYQQQLNQRKPVKLIPENKIQSNLKSDQFHETLFNNKLKISHRISYQGNLDSDPRSSNPSVQDSHINYNPFMWHHDDDVYMRESLKKQRPPLMEHSELNYQSTSSCFQEHTPFRFSEDFTQIVNKEPQKLEKLQSCKQSSILPNSEKKNRGLGTESIMETFEGLQTMKQLKPMKKNKKAFYIKVDSSSEEDNQEDKIMKISHKMRNGQSSGNIAFSICSDNFTKFDIPKSNLQPINENIDEGKDQSQVQSKNSSSNLYNFSDFQTQSIQQLQNRLASERSRSTEILKSVEIRYQTKIQQLIQKHNQEISEKDMKIDELAWQVSKSQDIIRNLELRVKQLESNKQEISARLLAVSLRIDDDSQRIEDSENFQLSLTQYKKLIAENKQSKKLLESKQSLINTLSRQLELFTSMNSRSVNHQPSGIKIQFLNEKVKSQTLPLLGTNSSDSYYKQLESVIKQYEKHIIKNLEFIKILQNCLESSILELIERQEKKNEAVEKINSLQWQNQELRKIVEILSDKVGTQIVQTKNVEGSGSQSSISQKQSGQQSEGQLREREMSNCSTIKL